MHKLPYPFSKQDNYVVNSSPVYYVYHNVRRSKDFLPEPSGSTPSSYWRLMVARMVA